MRDIPSLIGVPVTNFMQAIQQESKPDLLAFAASFREGYGKVSVLLSRYRTTMFTSEGWMIIGADNIYLR